MSALLIIDGEQIPVTPDSRHEYVLNTAEVAKGYGVDRKTIQKHKTVHADELIEGKHWVATNGSTLGGQQDMTLWTKRGVVMLGFFIRSERAKKFRSAAEDLIVGATPAVMSPATRRAMALIERMQGEAVAKALDLIKPAPTYGTPSPTTGEPRTRLMRAYYTSRWAENELTRRMVEATQQQLELGEMLEELRAEDGRAIA